MKEIMKMVNVYQEDLKIVPISQNIKHHKLDCDMLTNHIVELKSKQINKATKRNFKRKII